MTFIDQKLLDGFKVPWVNNVVTLKKASIRQRIVRFTSLDYLLQSIDNNVSYFRWPGKWDDQNDGIFIRTPFIYNGQKGYHAYENEYYAQCWCHKENESVAMWKLYGNDLSKSLMLVSTVDKVMASLWDNSWTTVYSGEVSYVPDYELLDRHFFNKMLGGINGIQGNAIPRMLLYKSDAYEHENEFRFIHRQNDRTKQDGVLVNHCLPYVGILDRIILHPESPQSFETHVRSELSNRNYPNIWIQRSDLYTRRPSEYILS